MPLSFPFFPFAKEEENIIMVITGLRNISPIEMYPGWILRPDRRAGSGSQPGFISLAINLSSSVAHFPL